MASEGDYYKVAGGYGGVVWHDGRWHRFECHDCVLAAGVARKRMQGLMTPKAAEAFRGPVKFRHDVELNNRWRQALSRARAKHGVLVTDEQVRQEMGGPQMAAEGANMTPGTIVKWAKPNGASEASERMKVLEDNGSRLLVEDISGMAIRGSRVVSRDEIVEAEGQSMCAFNGEELFGQYERGTFTVTAMDSSGHKIGTFDLRAQPSEAAARVDGWRRAKANFPAVSSISVVAKQSAFGSKVIPDGLAASLKAEFASGGLTWLNRNVRRGVACEIIPQYKTREGVQMYVLKAGAVEVAESSDPAQLIEAAKSLGLRSTDFAAGDQFASVGGPICYGRVVCRNVTQEHYDTSSGDSHVRANELRTMGYTVHVSGLGPQVTPVGTVRMTMLTIDHKNGEPSPPPARLERFSAGQQFAASELFGFTPAEQGEAAGKAQTGQDRQARRGRFYIRMADGRLMEDAMRRLVSFPSADIAKAYLKNSDDKWVVEGRAGARVEGF